MARHVVSTHAQLHGGASCAIGCPRSSCRTPSKSVRPRRMAPCEGGRRRRSSGGLPAAFARRSARQWRDTWCQRMHNCTEKDSALDWIALLESPPPLDRRRLRRLRMVPCGDAGGSKRGIKRRLKATRAHAARLELRGRTRCLLARDASPACLRGDGCAGGEAPCAIDRNIASSAATIVRLATPSVRLPHTDT